MLSLRGEMRKRVRRLMKRVVGGRPGGVRHRVGRKLGFDLWPPSATGEGDAASRSSGASGASAPDAVPTGFRLAMRAPFPALSQVAEVVVDGASLVISNVEGVFYASTAVCPHAGGPLGDGGLSGAALTCPYHGWAFDVRDGSCVVDPNVRLPTFDVWVRGDELFVRR